MSEQFLLSDKYKAFLKHNAPVDMGLREVVKNMVMKALNITPAEDNQVSIKEPLSHSMNTLRNRIWYRGDPSELDQFFKQTAQDAVSKSRFWAAVPSEDSSIRKFYSGIPGEIADKLADIVVADLEGIYLGEQTEKGTVSEEQTLWDEIAKDNTFSGDLLADGIKDTLIDGDGVFKLSVDTEISQYPLVEFYSGSDVSYTIKTIKRSLYQKCQRLAI